MRVRLRALLVPWRCTHPGPVRQAPVFSPAAQLCAFPRRLSHLSSDRSSQQGL